MGKPKQTFDVLFEDDHLVLVNKPPLLLTIPDRFTPEKPNLYHLLQEHYGKIFIVHRLDRETSGILCFAKTEEAHKDLSRQFEQRTVEKIYLALCEGVFLEQEGRIDLGIAPHPTVSGKMITSNKGKSALTTYKVLDTFRTFTLVEAEIHTGRTHQIRVHLKSIGHPLAVDPIYNPQRQALYLSEFKRKKFNLSKDEEERPLLARTSLHAHQLTFDHPHTRERTSQMAPLPKDMAASLKQLEKWGR